MEPAPKLSDARRALLQRYLSGSARTPEKHATISKRSETGAAPLSFSQQQIWLHSQIAGEALIYNEPITIHRRGELSVQALERSFTEIVRRHEAWRTTFHWSGEEGQQVVQPAAEHIDIPFVDLRSHSEPEPEALRLATADALQPFDLARGPMYRLRLVRVAEAEHRLFLTLHHIIFDGVSLYRILLPEWLRLYSAILHHEPAGLPELPIQYPDFAAWQRSSVNGIARDQQQYWEPICRDLPVLDLPTDRPRPPRQTYAGAIEPLAVPAATSAALKQLSHDQGTTPFITMVAAFMTLLHGYSGQEEIAVGGVSSGRRHTETMGLLGCFLNTVPIRCAIAKELPFTELLTRVRTATLGALSHDEVPFELLVQKFAPQRDPSRAPLVQALIVVEPPLEPLPEGWGFTHMDVETGTAKFDLQLGLDDRAEGMTGRFIYNTDLFDRATIALLATRWMQLLDLIVAAPDRTLSELRSTAWESPTPPSQPLPEWSGARTDYPREAAIHALFEEQACRTPTACAVVFGATQLTYEQLNGRADLLARELRKRGVTRDQPVGVYMERSLEVVIALLAILKAGGAYVPLDPAYPSERLRFMIDDTDAHLILTSAELKQRSSAFANDERFVCLDNQLLSDAGGAELVHVGAEDLAYIMYTSGSTGTPKGVAVPHRAVVRLVKDTDYASFSTDETFLQLAPLSFDASTFEIWGALLNGGKLVVMPAAQPTLQDIGAAIRDHNISMLWLTAALFNAMVDERLADLRPVRQLLTGGDVLSVAHVRKALVALPRTRLINGYGPTESTTFACCHTINSESVSTDAIPIGRPIANTTAFILSGKLEPLPVGVTGELCLGGDGLARGYWQREAVTAEKFVANPFSDTHDDRLYRTGDLACWRADGSIEFLGRADNQVKLRGFRIELGEIEAALKQQPGVRDGAVLLREDLPNEKRLVAYVVCERAAARLVDAARLRAALSELLPEYMVPSRIVAMPALPRTANGKLDRAALPVPPVTKEFVPASTALETQIADVWARALGVEQVGMTDNFFELGGHSLLGLRVVNQLRELALGEVPLTYLFQAPTVPAFARLLEGRAHTSAQPLPRVAAVNRESRRVRRS